MMKTCLKNLKKKILKKATIIGKKSLKLIDAYVDKLFQTLLIIINIFILYLIILVKLLGCIV